MHVFIDFWKLETEKSILHVFSFLYKLSFENSFCFLPILSCQTSFSVSKIENCFWKQKIRGKNSYQTYPKSSIQNKVLCWFWRLNFPCFRMYLMFVGVELKLWVSFVATLFFFFDLGLKYSCLVVWVDLYCSPFVWIKFSHSPKWKKDLRGSQKHGRIQNVLKA